MTTWTKQKFKNFCKLQRGFDLPNDQRIDGEYPVVASTSINGFHNEYKVNLPCVTTGRSGALGDVLFINENCWPLNTTLWVKDFYGNDPKFVYYKLKTLQLETFNSGAGVPTLNRNHLDQMQISIPDHPTQQTISATLSLYDSLIETNEKRTKVLEEMAQRLYVEWFVKFKFPGHEKVKMVDSHLGKIPEGWEVVTVEDLLDGIKRKPKIKTTEYLDKGLFPIVDQGREFIAGYTENQEAIYNEDLIVFGDHTRVLKYCNFSFACGADGTQLLKSNDMGRMPQILLYYVVVNTGLQNYQYARHFKFLKALKVIKPNSETALNFENAVAPRYELIQKLNLQNKNLTKTRDLLIPQLVTGRRKLNS